MSATDDIESLRKRVQNQRRELRRLNKILGPYWAGFRRGLEFEAACALRGKMNHAFGHEKVWAAEHCNCGKNKSGVLTGGWKCPIHGQQW